MQLSQLNGAKIAITGANSMVGRAVYAQAAKLSTHLYPIYHNHYDLLNQKDTMEAVRCMDFVIHCAGYNGNISFNKSYPADIFYRTSMMALNILKSSQAMGVKKVVSPLSSCAYPDTDVLNEAEFFAGAPNTTVEAHGFSKRIILEYSRQLFKQHGFVSVGVVFNTCYGPYDSFDVEKTKVVGGLITKFCEAKKKSLPYVECWGTGNPRRELIYVEDAARALLSALVDYNDTELPLNCGTGTDTSIKELAETIAQVVGYEGEIRWDTTKPDGQYRKLLDNKRMIELFGQVEFTNLHVGLEKTIEWYNNVHSG